MFNNKKDPVADTIKGIMNRTALRNKVEEALNEQLGVSSRKAIPHEYLAQYDAMLAEQQAEAEKKTGAPTPTEGDKAEAASLESKKDLPNPIADRLMKQGSYTPAAREGKAVPPLKKLQEKLSPKQQKLAELNPPKKKIDAGDFEALRDKKEQQLQEKATEAQQEKVARVMDEYKEGKLHSGSKEGPKVTDEKQAVAIAMSQAGLSKNKMDESLQSIQEEIRNNLIQKLNYIYESEGEEAARNHFYQLNEEEQGILRGIFLREADGFWNKIFDNIKRDPEIPPYRPPATGATAAGATPPPLPAAGERPPPLPKQVSTAAGATPPPLPAAGATAQTRARPASVDDVVARFAPGEEERIRKEVAKKNLGLGEQPKTPPGGWKFPGNELRSGRVPIPDDKVLKEPTNPARLYDVPSGRSSDCAPSWRPAR